MPYIVNLVDASLMYVFLKCKVSPKAESIAVKGKYKSSWDKLFPQGSVSVLSTNGSNFWTFCVSRLTA